jgi:hypothetical protein
MRILALFHGSSIYALLTHYPDPVGVKKTGARWPIDLPGREPGRDPGPWPRPYLLRWMVPWPKTPYWAIDPDPWPQTPWPQTRIGPMTKARDPRPVTRPIDPGPVLGRDPGRVRPRGWPRDWAPWLDDQPRPVTGVAQARDPDPY